MPEDGRFEVLIHQASLLLLHENAESVSESVKAVVELEPGKTGLISATKASEFLEMKIEDA